ncbi:MAG: hypothetical protein OEM15_06760 [Myxococcales bacterium]|nr:hypothetical protein [Myxococcales bacterium]MDH3483348.1 hypothetical protein [Myxococcales bacterium]
MNREGTVPGEEKLLSRVALPDVPTDRVDNVWCQRERQRFVALARAEKRWALLGAPLDRPVDGELGPDVADAAFGDGVHLAGPQTESGGEVEERVPPRLHAEHAVEKAIALLFGVPLGSGFGDAFHRHVRHRCEKPPLPHKPKDGPHQ